MHTTIAVYSSSEMAPSMRGSSSKRSSPSTVRTASTLRVAKEEMCPIFLSPRSGWKLEKPMRTHHSRILCTSLMLYLSARRSARASVVSIRRLPSSDLGTNSPSSFSSTSFLLSWPSFAWRSLICERLRMAFLVASSMASNSSCATRFMAATSSAASWIAALSSAESISAAWACAFLLLGFSLAFLAMIIFFRPGRLLLLATSAARPITSRRSGLFRNASRHSSYVTVPLWSVSASSNRLLTQPLTALVNFSFSDLSEYSVSLLMNIALSSFLFSVSLQSMS
mmetsp:Transcript_25965/g.88858  ORF Transcript_25965/g.88858 Transcript_25965/m.88858 type:complete len:282 (-) Transcript_25965:644-1489(-)